MTSNGQEWFHQYTREVYSRVPAYKKFLKNEGFDFNEETVEDDFSNIPTMNKKNYLRAYPLKEVLLDGKLGSGDIISMSSGTSGVPFYWLRGTTQHEEAAEIYEKMYKTHFSIDSRTTLFVVCFSMGTWIAGSYTTLGAMQVSQKGYNLNIVTPGLEKKDAIQAIRDLSPEYEQVVVAGYPPFIKDLVEYGSNQSFDWKSINVGFTLAGESISEDWRTYLAGLVSDTPNEVKILNIYGTADAGIVGHETDLSILVRKELERLGLNEKFFGSQTSPSFLQFDSSIRHVEVVQGNVVFTARGALPLVRYDINDRGGVYTLADFSEHVPVEILEGLDGYSEYKDYPFVYLQGRADNSATLYAVLVYPDNIRDALLQPKMSSVFTSRFVMKTEYTKAKDQYLHIILELRDNVTEDSAPLTKVVEALVVSLKGTNAEYRKLHESIGDKAVPIVSLRPYGDEQYFSSSSNKQRWAD